MRVSRFNLFAGVVLVLAARVAAQETLNFEVTAPTAGSFSYDGLGGSLVGAN